MSLTNSPYWFGGGVDSFYPTQINDSLRFEDGSSAVLTRTPSSASNRKTWTYSFWVKRANLTSYEGFLAVGTGDGSEDFFGFTTTHKLYFRYSSGSDFTSTQVFRDVSSWYHIVLVADTTQSQSSSTASDSRLRYYVNGTQITAFDSSTMPSQNFDFRINSAAQHYIGEFPRISSHLDGYLSNIHFIDGQALDPTSFGEEKDGTWIPKSYSGSYGTNGFHLEFNSNTNDSSGNGNNWTANNISAHDYVPDSPTNNWVTLNTLDKYSSATISEGNLEIGLMTNSWINQARATMFVNSGKWYWEVYQLGTGGFWKIGIRDNDAALTSNTTSSTGFEYYAANGNKHSSSGAAAYSSETSSQGNVYAFALDMDAGTLTLYVNNVSQGTMFSGLSGYYAPTSSSYNGILVYNFGQDSTFAGGTTAGGNSDANGVGDFKYSVPSGFLALASASLPEPTIIDGSEHFTTMLHSGTGSQQAVTGAGFAPDFRWSKSRDTAYSHILHDNVRGETKYLQSNNTNKENTLANMSLDSDGFTVHADDLNDPQVSWLWKAGTSFSNSAGSNGATIASSGSVNTDAGFSIVRWDGNSTAPTTQSIGHGLGNTPSLIIVKAYDAVSYGAQNWVVWHKDFGANENLYLSLTNAKATQANIFGGTSATLPNSNTFSVGYYGEVNYVGYDYIAYCFANSDIIKAGSYTGNGSADGTFVYAGFRPAFLIIKRTDSANWWNMFDSVREPTNDGVNFNYLQAESNNSENNNGAALYPALDFLSNGFKLRYNGATQNASGGTYLYFAFAETPAKYSNAR